VESSLWKRLWTCRKTDYLNEMTSLEYGKENKIKTPAKPVIIAK
jgi:hypothetical protein